MQNITSTVNTFNDFHPLRCWQSAPLIMVPNAEMMAKMMALKINSRAWCKTIVTSYTIVLHQALELR